MADYQAMILATDKNEGAKEGLSTSNMRKTVEYCLAHPQWKLSLQTHKWLGID
jgi:organic radical activating enzyme